MAPPAARIGDMHTCPMVNPGPVPHVGGPILPPCAVTVITGGMPQARVGDMAVCVGPLDVIAKGSATVIVSGMPAARIGDSTAHGGVIVVGFPTVLIGDAGGGGGGKGAAGAGLEGGGSFVQPAVQAKTLIAAAKDGTPFCERCNAIERNYQVAEEASPLPRNLTITEGKLLVNLTLNRGGSGLKNFKSIHDDAFLTSESRILPRTAIPDNVEAQIQKLPLREQKLARNLWPINDGHTDAFRHAYWNARLTSEFGADWTSQFATAHEGNNLGNSTREAMDLYNNRIGRQIATNSPGASPTKLADLVKKALDSGDLVVLDADGHIAWSNNVAVGHHGISISLDNVPNAINVPESNASAR